MVLENNAIPNSTFFNSFFDLLTAVNKINAKLN